MTRHGTRWPTKSATGLVFLRTQKDALRVAPPLVPFWPRVVLVVAVLLVALAGCASQTSREPVAAPSIEPLTVNTLAGERVRVPGQQPTVMLFFTPGCASCEDAARAVVSASQPATSDARFLAIDLDPSGDPETIDRFLARVGGQDLPAVVDRDVRLTQTFDVNALGTVVIVDPDGTVSYRAVEPSADQIVHALRKGAGS